MQSPEGRQRQSQGGLLKDKYAERVHESGVRRVQCEINPVIAAGMRAIAKNGVIDQVGERGNWPVEARGSVHVPIGAGQNGMNIVRSGIPDARILLDYRATVEKKPS